jgi:hypothetical protein
MSIKSVIKTVIKWEKDFSIWSDHMDLLKKLTKTLRSPKYICPHRPISNHNKILNSKTKPLTRERTTKIEKGN